MGKAIKTEGEGLFKSVFMAYSVLLMHVLLIVAVGCLILFFRGFLHYMVWVFLGASAAILVSGWFFFRKIRQRSQAIGETLNSPVFQGRDVEVSLLGGIASVKIGKPGNHPTPGQGHYIESGAGHAIKQLEDPETSRIRELNNLAQLLEKDLITPEEFLKAKQQIFNHSNSSVNA